MARKFPKKNLPELLSRLRETYPNLVTALNHKNSYELITATILSAQCTDERVNKVTPVLFQRFPTPAALAAGSQKDVEELVHSTGFYRNKAKNIRGMAKGLEERHQGEVPPDMDALLALPGVARKTANVVLGTAFGIREGVVVDTHVKRISNLLGLTRASDPKAIEKDLMRQIPKESWIDFPHMLILHGRAVCIARRPACERCPIMDLCGSAKSEAMK